MTIGRDPLCLMCYLLKELLIVKENLLQYMYATYVHHSVFATKYFSVMNSGVAIFLQVNVDYPEGTRTYPITPTCKLGVKVYARKSQKTVASECVRYVI